MMDSMRSSSWPIASHGSSVRLPPGARVEKSSMATSGSSRYPPMRMTMDHRAMVRPRVRRPPLT